MEEFFGTIFESAIPFVFLIIIIVGAIYSKAIKNTGTKDNDDIEQQAKPKATKKPTDAKQPDRFAPRTSQYVPIQPSIDARTTSTMKSRLEDHHHAEDGEEAREVYEGSLGGVSEEGCHEFDNVRLLTKIDIPDDEDTVNYDVIRTIVLGDALCHRKSAVYKK